MPTLHFCPARRVPCLPAATRVPRLSFVLLGPSHCARPRGVMRQAAARLSTGSPILLPLPPADAKCLEAHDTQATLLEGLKGSYLMPSNALYLSSQSQLETLKDLSLADAKQIAALLAADVAGQPSMTGLTEATMAHVLKITDSLPALHSLFLLFSKASPHGYLVSHFALAHLYTQRGHLESGYVLCEQYLRGHARAGLAPDLERAARLLEALARDGSPKACYTLGVNQVMFGMTFPGQTPAPDPAIRRQGVESLRRAWDQGIVEAGTQLGSIYLNGVIVERDLAQSATYLEAAHEAGSIEATYLLAGLYGSGQQSPKGAPDLAKCFELNLHAANRGLPAAQHNVGCFYMEGNTPRPLQSHLPPEPSPSPPIDGYSDSAPSSGNAGTTTNAQPQRESTADVSAIAAPANSKPPDLVPGPVPRDVILAIEYWKMAAEGGVQLSQINLGRLYMYGNSPTVPQDTEQAQKYLQQCVKFGGPLGQEAQRLLHELPASKAASKSSPCTIL